MGINMDMSINIASLSITPQMLSLIAEIDEFKGAWRALGTLAPDRLSALRRVATIESIGSSTRIEGSKLSDSDVERLLSNIEIRHFDTRDEQEVAGYAESEGVLAEFQAKAIKEVIAWQLAAAMQERKLTKTKLAQLMQTSRTQINRVLDPEDGNVTIETLQRAAALVQLELV